MTGTEAEDQVIFDQVAANEVADDDGHDKVEGPDPAFFAKIQGGENQQEKVEGDPELRFAYKEEDVVQGSAGPVLVDTGE